MHHKIHTNATYEGEFKKMWNTKFDNHSAADYLKSA